MMWPLTLLGLYLTGLFVSGIVGLGVYFGYLGNFFIEKDFGWEPLKSKYRKLLLVTIVTPFAILFYPLTIPGGIIYAMVLLVKKSEIVPEINGLIEERKWVKLISVKSDKVNDSSAAIARDTTPDSPSEKQTISLHVVMEPLGKPGTLPFGGDKKTS